MGWNSLQMILEHVGLWWIHCWSSMDRLIRKVMLCCWRILLLPFLGHRLRTQNEIYWFWSRWLPCKIAEGGGQLSICRSSEYIYTHFLSIFVKSLVLKCSLPSFLMNDHCMYGMCIYIMRWVMCSIYWCAPYTVASLFLQLLEHIVLLNVNKIMLNHGKWV